MDHWPEWGMPVENWQQQGSYVSPIEEALPDPAAGTLVCIPPLNPALLKYIAGCLDQLRNPSTYEGLSDADIALSLQRADTLRGLVGHPVACVPPAMYEVRLDGCVLEQSTDGGATWSAVAGWDGLAACLPSLASTAISVPSNPLGVSTEQQACNIAGYVAQQIIQGVFNTLQQAISEGRSAIQFATDLTVGAFIFRTVFPYTTAALLGIDALLSLGASIGASELTTIVADVVLWDDIKCAIYRAIKADGHITASNWPTAIANVRAISYGVPLVAGGIADWLQSADMATVYEWQQLAPLDSVDCSPCARWCQTWDFTAVDFPGWSTYQTPATTRGVNGYVGAYIAANGPPTTETGIVLPIGHTLVNGIIDIAFVAPSDSYTGSGGGLIIARASGHADINYSPVAGHSTAVQHFTLTGINQPVDTLYIILRALGNVTPIQIRAVTIKGDLTSPYGPDNCVY